MAELNVKEIKKRFKAAETHKEHWRAEYSDAYEFALPMRNLYDGYYEQDTPGTRKMKRVFDSTAVHSTSRFANRIQSSLFPPQRDWCRLVPGNEIPQEQHIETQRVLDFYTERMFGVMRQSGFDLAMGEMLLDLAIGTACLLIQPSGDDTKPIRYTAIPSFHVCFEEGPNGQVNTVYRKFKRPYNVLQLEFPDATIPKEVTDKYQEKPTAKVELLEATYEKDGFIYYCLSTMEGDHKLVSRTLQSFPWVIARYMKASGEIYGRGPVLYALPDILTCNKVKELALKNASLSIGGVFTAVDDGVLNPQTINIQPGSVIPVNSNGGPRGASLMPLPRSGDANLSQIEFNDLRMNIKKMLLDDSLPPDTMSARSATEIMERMKDLSANLGAAFGRMIDEIMYPIVTRTLNLMDEMGMIDLPLKVNGLQVNIQPISPLAMAGNAENINSVMQFMQISQAMGPQGQMLINTEKVGDYVADMLGIPGEIRTTQQERQEMQQQMMAAMQQQMAMAQPQQEAAPPQEGQ